MRNNNGASTSGQIHPTTRPLDITVTIDIDKPIGTYSKRVWNYFRHNQTANTMPLPVPESNAVHTKTLVRWIEAACQNPHNTTLPVPKDFAHLVGLYTAGLLLQVPPKWMVELESPLRRALQSRDLTQTEMRALEELFANEAVRVGRNTDVYDWSAFHELVLVVFASLYQKRFSSAFRRNLRECPWLWTAVRRLSEGHLLKYPDTPDLADLVFGGRERMRSETVTRIEEWREDVAKSTQGQGKQKHP